MPVENLFPLLVSSWAVHKESFFQTLHELPVDMATENFCQVRNTGIGLDRCSLTSFPTPESYCRDESVFVVYRFGEEKTEKKYFCKLRWGPMAHLHIFFWLNVPRQRGCTTSSDLGPSVSNKLSLQPVHSQVHRKGKDHPLSS